MKAAAPIHREPAAADPRECHVSTFPDAAATGAY